jgi:hypothetical protein
MTKQSIQRMARKLMAERVAIPAMKIGEYAIAQSGRHRILVALPISKSDLFA